MCVLGIHMFPLFVIFLSNCGIIAFILLSYNIEAYYIVPIGKWFSKFSNWNLVIFTALLCSGWPFPRNVNVEIVLECTTFGNAIYILINRISGVMISVIPSSAINRGFEPRSGQTKDYTISICCFFAKHSALRRKSKYWLARNENNVTCLSVDCCFGELAL